MYSQGYTLASTLFFVLYRNVKYLTVIDNADLYFGLVNCKVVLGCFKSWSVTRSNISRYYQVMGVLPIKLNGEKRLGRCKVKLETV